MSKIIPKVVHLTSAHPRYDTRIFFKMCSSLALSKFDVTLVVADGKGPEVRNGVAIVDVGAKTGGRIARMTKTVDKVFKEALSLDADIYHLHDPELIPTGLKLIKRGKKVVFDAHEDLPQQLLAKPYLSGFTRFILSKTFEIYERWVCPRFDAIVAATPHIREKFLKINGNTVDINNFPIMDELANSSPWEQKDNEVVYVGGIAKIRGILEIVKAMEFTDNIRLNLAGQFSESAIEDIVKQEKSWVKINELGFLNRSKIHKVLSKSKAGLVTLHPVINYLDALPVKMFEYMAAGIPVIASDFPLWREIVESNDCGICVDPLDPEKIGEAIQYLVEHPEYAERLGKNGRRAVETKFNWAIEEAKLISLYETLV